MDEHEHHQDIFRGSDGSETYRDPWIVEGEGRLTGSHSGSICVHGGASFEIARGAHHSGSLTFRSDSVGHISGKHSGSLHVARRAKVDVRGDQSGSVHVARGAVVRVASEGRLAGSLHIEGLIENRGARGGSVHLSGGEVLDVEGGRVKQPTMRNGVSVYEW
jgi:hypothetical protein